MSFSSDLVFDGHKADLYIESDPIAPLNAYGRSKGDYEHALLAMGGRHLLIRTAAFFSAFDPHNFARHVYTALSQGHRFRAACDQVVSPTFVPALVDAALDLLIDDAGGLWHLSHGEPVTWSDFAMALARHQQADPTMIDAVEGRSLGWIAPRPCYSALGSEKGLLLPQLDESIARFLRDLDAHSASIPASPAFA